MLTINKTLKRIKGTEKVPRMEGNKHKKTKEAEIMNKPTIKMHKRTRKVQEKREKKMRCGG
jgi:hypothetical protein